MTIYKIHPFAETFPPFSDAEFESLLQDIGEHGQREPITLFEGKVLDGVHRLRVCTQLHIEPRVRNYTGKDPLGFSVSENLKRRHLNESQRAMVAAKLLGSQNGNRPITMGTPEAKGANLHPTTRASAARILNVSKRSVATAKEVLKDASASVIKSIESGKTTVSAVAKQIREKKKNRSEHQDKIGCPIPDDVWKDWQEAEAREDICRQVHRLKLTVEKALEENELVFREITNSTVADLHNAWSALQGLIPYAVCPTCEGHNRATCTLCKQRGFLSRFAYEHYVPKKSRELREKLNA